MSGGILDSFQTIIPTAAAVLSERRQMLRMTQQEVADRANITLRQYQRLESVETNAGATYQHLRHGWQLDDFLTEIQEGDLYLCVEQRIVKVREEKIELTAKEFDILSLLIMNPNRVFTYELIMDLVWNEDYAYYSRKAINNHVCNLRKKLKIDPGDPDYIKSVTGIGYKFVLP